MNAKHLILVLIAALFLAACGTAAKAEPADPAAVAQEFWGTVNAGDLEAAMALVSDDFKAHVDEDTSDKEAMRASTQSFIDEGLRTEISNLKVEGDTVTYDWVNYRKDGSVEWSGVDTLHIKDGLIVLMETDD